ncbi:hypothetical protein PIROE2DRAFT_8083 [Piromyces sp. E2]|nr:hypothetical protein PIROE2DRAFT_8083 [Piromyces sp. E2]|eukprot:OUM65020.1 hypothetical protein PIROE2DRAFT_8083 [Piromyces sp. E2]
MPSLNPLKFLRLDPYTTSLFYHNNKFSEYKADIHQKLILDCTLSDPFLYWLLIVLLLNIRRWKRPVISVVLKKGDLTLIQTTCIIFNISKVIGIIMLYIFKPTDFEIPSKEAWKNMKQDVILEFSFISSIAYDLAIIYVLRKNVFKKAKTQNQEKQGFIEKFKLISEYRIFLSIIINFITISVIALFIFLNNQSRKKGEAFDMSNTAFIHFFNIAQSFNYYIMYIDQILLRFYTAENNSKYKKYIHKTSTFSISRELPYTLNRINYLGSDINNDGISLNTSLNRMKNVGSDINSDVIHPNTSNQMNDFENDFNTDTISYNSLRQKIPKTNYNAYHFNNDINTTTSNRSSFIHSDNSYRDSYYQSEVSYSPNPLLSHNSRNSMCNDYPASIVPPVPPIPVQYKQNNRYNYY